MSDVVRRWRYYENSEGRWVVQAQDSSFVWRTRTWFPTEEEAVDYIENSKKTINYIYL